MAKRTASEDLTIWAKRVSSSSGFLPRKSMCSDLFWNILTSSFGDREREVYASEDIHDTAIRITDEELHSCLDILKICLEDN